ncbi:hypothetical protein FNV43_RR13975 [Rhamnella rubrinervis]|uniref:non-specific serine/threonine protein kinase n=1 Tax=Rhamnella rubrinervis TaxID=2594499 RepID=A0A8K0H2B9_9ROSA|nr:hypothetical protein FNV43_RR13975 [Rhamnella rubrinervis]
MNSKLYQPHHHLLLLPFSLFLLFIKFLPCSSFDWYNNCRNRFNCGNITNIDYPFWGGGRPEGCGHPDLHLLCEGSQTKIHIKDVKYNVLAIDQDAQTLQISRDDFWDGLCSPKFPNTTFDPNQFEYSPIFGEIILLYDCAPDPPWKFSCPGRSAHKFGFITIGVTTWTCKSNLKVGIRRSSFDHIMDPSAMLEALREGFEVKYKMVDMGLCGECTKSNGVCGYNWDTKQPNCYCAGHYVSTGKTCPPPSSPPTGQKADDEIGTIPNFFLSVLYFVFTFNFNF